MPKQKVENSKKVEIIKPQSENGNSEVPFVDSTSKKSTSKKTENPQEAEAIKPRTSGNKNSDSEVLFADLSNKDIPVEILKEIPESAAVFYRFVPIQRDGNTLEVGMIEPDDLKAREALRFILRRRGLRIRIFSINKAGLNNVLKQYRTLRGEVTKALQELEEELTAKEKAKPIKKTTGGMAKKVVTEAPITKIVAVILRHAIEGRASDIHIEPVEEEIKIRFRVDGILYTSIVLPKEIHPAVVSRVKILSNLKIDETRVPQDGRFRTVVVGKKVDFRVSTFPTSAGEKVVLRVLDSSAGVKSFIELGVQEYHLRILEDAIYRPFGMILLTGPTGSGKTTTLYAILSKLNSETVNIVSLEDPVEYCIEGISQSQIRPEIEYTFASGLRHILRQDPDVIMVGEIRDEETANLAIHAALTGHILLSTLHTNNAVGVIPRLIDLNVGQFLIPSSLILAIAQRLTRRLCPHCKKEVPASPQITKIIKEELAGLSPDHQKDFPWKEPFKVYRADGCKFCSDKGTKGRIALYEMLSMTPQLEEILNIGVSETKLREEAQRQGMITMKQDGISKVLQGIITFEEMIRKVEE